MSIAKITGQGLAAISLLVVLLWGCVLGEWMIVRRARTEVGRTLLENYRMQREKQSQPVSAPAPIIRKQPRPALG